jgi:hypothetical protein
MVVAIGSGNRKDTRTIPHNAMAGKKTRSYAKERVPGDLALGCILQHCEWITACPLAPFTPAIRKII